MDCLVKCGAVLVLVFAAFVAHPCRCTSSLLLVALPGAGMLIVVSGPSRSGVYPASSGTRCCFSSLFIMVGALVKTGAVNDLARAATQLTGGNIVIGPPSVLTLWPDLGIITTFPTSPR